jgi:hypothetical protein
MSTIADSKVLTATWRNGQVILDGPADWPEGSKLQVAAIAQPVEPIGIPDDQWPRDLQGIAELLQRMDQIEPFVMTPEEEEDWLAWRQKMKEYDLAMFDKRIEGLFE